MLPRALASQPWALAMHMMGCHLSACIVSQARGGLAAACSGQPTHPTSHPAARTDWGVLCRLVTTYLMRDMLPSTCHQLGPVGVLKGSASGGLPLIHVGVAAGGQAPARQWLVPGCLLPGCCGYHPLHWVKPTQAPVPPCRAHAVRNLPVEVSDLIQIPASVAGEEPASRARAGRGDSSRHVLLASSPARPRRIACWRMGRRWHGAAIRHNKAHALRPDGIACGPTPAAATQIAAASLPPAAA